ncbi:putative oxidoreductase [Phycisphaera mikurensis NBRC 102666]|uniref:Putative oxidoreductase n=2 Tax=Phycisphaera TaxID=666508 RepID=I0ID56_PHYMF|nr:putative oxidoreductase [Phycisphaera mikurensis NBRC 102666]
MERMKTVVVGCGGMSRTWVQEALAAERIDLVGLVDLEAERARAMADSFGIDQGACFRSLGEAVRATGADAVFDVTVPAAHAAVTLEALELGCHVLGEKPMSDSLENGRRMVDAAQAAGRVYAVTQTRRALPGVLSVEAFLREGGLGEVAELHSDFYLGCHFGGFREEMEHPLVLDMAIHTFDNARQISGREPVTVYAESWNPAHSWYRGDASAVAVFEMTGGLRYTYRGSWCNEGNHTSWAGDWRVAGSRGSLAWDGADAMEAQRLAADPGEGFHRELETIDVPRVTLEHEGHAHLIRQFAEHVCSGGRTPLACPAADNLPSLAMVLAAVESLRTGNRVPVRW